MVCGLIYFTLLALEITVMTQILNLCFLGGYALFAIAFVLLWQDGRWFWQ
jgi:hypothetical protein